MASETSLHPLLAQRWSPRTWAADQRVSDSEVDSLIEAARWAPSAGNSQPWGFIVGLRGDDVHRRLAAHLARSSAAWAPSAALLIANLSQVHVEDTDWEYSEFSEYDVGQAVAYLTVQAQSLGLSVRQFRAFDQDAVAAEFAIPPHWRVLCMAAVGRAEVPDRLEPLAEPPRLRRPRHELLWPTVTGARA